VTVTIAPTTVPNVEQAIEQYGAFGQAYLDGMWAGDPLADAFVADMDTIGRGSGMRLLRQALAEGIDAVLDAPESLVALFKQLDTVPDWVDFDLLDEGARHSARYNRQSGIVLGASSLLIGYANTNASRPLQMTGRYIENAGARTIEVGIWLREATAPSGLTRHSLGFERTVRVRLIHAMVRHHLQTSPEWDLDAWGMPISQAHLAYTLVEFALVPLRGLAQIGAPYLPHEIRASYARWRYIGHLLGVEPTLLPVTEADQQRLEELHLLTRPPVEDFCRDLVRGINKEFLVPEIELLLPNRPGIVARQAAPIVYGLERIFLGEQIADELGVPAARTQPSILHAGRALAAVNRRLDRSERMLELRTRLGDRYADKQEARLRERYSVRHDLVDASPETGRPHPARVSD
jgi:hypothetical protein